MAVAKINKTKPVMNKTGRMSSKESSPEVTEDYWREAGKLSRDFAFPSGAVRDSCPFDAWAWNVNPQYSGQIFDKLLEGLPIKAMNSRRVAGLSRKAPSMRLVTMVTPGLRTPRVVMH